MSNKAEAATVLRHAAEIVRDQWISGSYRCADKDGHQSFCAVGAIQEAARRLVDNLGLRDKVRARAYKALAEQGLCDVVYSSLDAHDAIIMWNDGEVAHKADYEKKKAGQIVADKMLCVAESLEAQAVLEGEK